MPPHTVDLSVSKGLYWWKQQKPSKEGILVSARRVTGNSADSTVFTHVTYGHSADRFAAADRRGNIYVFHLRSNRFSLIHAATQEVVAPHLPLCHQLFIHMSVHPSIHPHF